jgi:hypothetical protein
MPIMIKLENKDPAKRTLFVTLKDMEASEPIGDQKTIAHGNIEEFSPIVEIDTNKGNVVWTAEYGGMVNTSAELTVTGGNTYDVVGP